MRPHARLFLLLGAVAVIGAGIVVSTKEPRAQQPPLSAKAQALKDQVIGFENMQLAIKSSYIPDGSYRGWRRVPGPSRGTVHVSSDCRVVYDNAGGTRTTWDGETLWYAIPPFPEEDIPPRASRLTPLGPFLQQICSDLRDGTITWVTRHPSEYGYMRADGGGDYVELELPYVWAQGFNVFVLLYGSGRWNVLVYWMEGGDWKRVKFFVEQARFDLDLPPQAFDAWAPPFRLPWPPPEPPAPQE